MSLIFHSFLMYLKSDWGSNTFYRCSYYLIIILYSFFNIQGQNEQDFVTVTVHIKTAEVTSDEIGIVHMNLNLWELL